MKLVKNTPDYNDNDGIWRLTYKIMGKTMVLERKFKHEIDMDMDDIAGYGAECKREFIRGKSKPDKLHEKK